MTAENIIGFVIFLFVALIMIGIGIVQMKSKKPVAFYTGEKPPKEEDLSIDFHIWNKKHGIIWIIYGIAIILTYLIALTMNDSIFMLILLLIGICLPIVFMVFYHQMLVNKYMK